MAHQLAFINNKASIAYVGDKPWHGLGQELTVGADFDTWQTESGMNFNIEEQDCLFYDPATDQVIQFPGRKALYRNDNQAPLAIVSDSFKVVQPKDVLQAQFDINEALGATMETAGVLFNGRRFWSLAKLGDNIDVGGGDMIGGYILIATACDGTLASTVRRTWVRVVCQNTLSMAVNGSTLEFKVPHQAKFILDDAKAKLGIDTSADSTMVDQIKDMAKTKIHEADAIKYFARVFAKARARAAAESEVMADLINASQGSVMDDLLAGKLSASEDELAAMSVLTGTDSKAVQQAYELWDGKGIGATMSSSDHTLWGMVNAVTEYEDHHRGAKTIDSRMDKAWFGKGESLKNYAYIDALDMLSSLSNF